MRPLRKATAQKTSSYLMMTLAVGFLCLVQAASAETPPAIPLKIGAQGKTTRLVFEFPRLTPYYAKDQNGDIALTFETRGEIPVPSNKTALIGAINAERVDAETVKMLVDIPNGATFKHYRQMRKVVVEISPPSENSETAAPAPESLQKPDAQGEALPPMDQNAAAPPPPAENTSAKTPAPAAEEPPSVATVVPSPAQEEQEVQEDETARITISTIEPTKIAVFSRFGTLWIVLDTEAAGALSPDVKGSAAGFLGKSKTLKFKGGSAYRYLLPPENHISVEKRGLTWDIVLSRKQLQTAPNTHLSVEFDQASGRGKLMTELKGAGRVLEFQDPAIGDTLFVIPTGQQAQRIDMARSFPDLLVLPASIGMVVKPLKDAIKVNRIEDFILITAPDGITATPNAVAGPSLISSANRANRKGDEGRLFDFPNWRQGGIAKLNENRRVLEGKIAAASTPDERSEMMMKLALLYFANNFGHETLGLLRVIEEETPDMAKNPNFIALRGSASALAGHYQAALKDLSNPAIQQHPEVNMWIGYAAAATEQWQMANRSFPKDNYYLVEYPENIAMPFTIYMAESALRLGQTDSAALLLSTLNNLTDEHAAHYKAATEYLRGEAARQQGDNEAAIRIWSPVAHGLDRLYHTKASLALANLQMQEKQVSAKAAIDTLDSLRFAWRGDGLEVQILHNLGKLKIEDGQFLAGLQDMKAATRLSESLLSDPAPIREDMARTISDLFTGKETEKISSLEAVSIYNEFRTLMPGGSEGALAALNLADYLIRMDLLDKAAEILGDQMDSGLLPPERQPELGARLAAIRLLDKLPDQALSALGRTEDYQSTPAVRAERVLLKARAQSQLKQTDAAIATLSGLGSRDALKLKADVLWRAGRWAEAADAIETILPPPEKLSAEEDIRLVVNAAVGYKLAGNPDKLSAIKNRYDAVMATTPLGATFGVVTRDGGGAALSDRDTILKIAGEVDMFKGFLDSYKASAGGS